MARVTSALVSDSEPARPVCEMDFRGIVLDLAVLILILGRLLGYRTRDIPDYKGREFIIAFMENEMIRFSEDIVVEPELFITTESLNKVEVKISMPLAPDLMEGRKFEVTQGMVEQILLPTAVLANGTGLENKGILIEGTEEIIVYGINKQPSSSDSFMGLPTDVLGTLYYAASYHEAQSPSTSELLIVATEPDTIVNVTLPGSEDAAPVLVWDGVEYKSNDTVTAVLQTYETMQLQSRTHDLTGARIQSTSPVAVFSGSEKTPIRGFTRDHLVEQLPPVNCWGKQFLVVPIALRLVGDIVRVIGSEDNTQVDIYMNSSVVETLMVGAGGFIQVELASDMYTTIESSAPVMTLQFGKSQNTDLRNTDPFMVLVPPSSQYDTAYRFATVKPGDKLSFDNFINLAVRQGAEEGIIMDGRAVRADWMPIAGSEYVGAQLRVEEGTHLIRHQSPIVSFGAIMYGHALMESYGYPAGMRLANIGLFCNITETEIGDGEDNDCDDRIDEEILNNLDDDNDGLVDEDLVEVIDVYPSTSTSSSGQGSDSGSSSVSANSNGHSGSASRTDHVTGSVSASTDSTTSASDSVDGNASNSVSGGTHTTSSSGGIDRTTSTTKSTSSSSSSLSTTSTRTSTLGVTSVHSTTSASTATTKTTTRVKTSSTSSVLTSLVLTTSVAPLSSPWTTTGWTYDFTDTGRTGGTYDTETLRRTERSVSDHISGGTSVTDTLAPTTATGTTTTGSRSLSTGSGTTASSDNSNSSITASATNDLNTETFSATPSLSWNDTLGSDYMINGSDISDYDYGNETFTIDPSETETETTYTTAVPPGPKPTQVPKKKKFPLTVIVVLGAVGGFPVLICVCCCAKAAMCDKRKKQPPVIVPFKNQPRTIAKNSIEPVAYDVAKRDMYWDREANVVPFLKTQNDLSKNDLILPKARPKRTNITVDRHSDETDSQVSNQTRSSNTTSSLMKSESKVSADVKLMNGVQPLHEPLPALNGRRQTLAKSFTVANGSANNVDYPIKPSQNGRKSIDKIMNPVYEGDRSNKDGFEKETVSKLGRRQPSVLSKAKPLKSTRLKSSAPVISDSDWNRILDPRQDNFVSSPPPLVEASTCPIAVERNTYRDIRPARKPVKRLTPAVSLPIHESNKQDTKRPVKNVFKINLQEMERSDSWS